MNRYRPDFEPKGIVKADPTTMIGYYVITGIWSVGGISTYLIILNSAALLMIWLGSGAVFALLSFIISETVYYWDEEQFAAVTPIRKPEVHRFEEVERVTSSYHSVTLYTESGKRYIIPCAYSGIEEFKAKLNASEKQRSITVISKQHKG